MALNMGLPSSGSPITQPLLWLTCYLRFNFWFLFLSQLFNSSLCLSPWLAFFSLLHLLHIMQWYIHIQRKEQCHILEQKIWFKWKSKVNSKNPKSPVTKIFQTHIIIPISFWIWNQKPLLHCYGCYAIAILVLELIKGGHQNVPNPWI